MKKTLILISHGDLCKYLKKSTEVITGPLDNVAAIPFDPLKGEDEFKNNLRKAIDETEYTVIFADLLGGTPCNIATQLVLENEKIELYSGMNMPMVITFLNSEMINKEMDLVENGMKGIKFVNDILKADNE